MISKIKEIIPVEDRLDEELANVKGGISSSGVVCGTGAVCDLGEVIDEPDEPIEEPFEPILV